MRRHRKPCPPCLSRAIETRIVITSLGECRLNGIAKIIRRKTNKRQYLLRHPAPALRPAFLSPVVSPRIASLYGNMDIYKVYAVARNVVDAAGNLGYTGNRTNRLRRFEATDQTSGKVYPNR